MGPDMESITDISIQDKMLTLSSIITTDYQHPKITTELDRVSIPTGHYNIIHCGSMCVEMTNHTTTQSMKTNNSRSNYSRQYTIDSLPCFFVTKKDFVPGGDVGGASR